MAVTVEMITALHKRRDIIRSEIEKATGRLSAINEQIDTTVQELAKYGRTPEDAPEFVTSMTATLEKDYATLVAALEEIENDRS